MEDVWNWASEEVHPELIDFYLSSVSPPDQKAEDESISTTTSGSAEPFNRPLHASLQPPFDAAILLEDLELGRVHSGRVRVESVWSAAFISVSLIPRHGPKLRSLLRGICHALCCAQTCVEVTHRHLFRTGQLNGRLTFLQTPSSRSLFPDPWNYHPLPARDA